MKKELKVAQQTDDLESRPLFEIAKEKCSLFRTPEFEAFGRMDMEGHLENWAIKSKYFWFWLLRLFYKIAGKMPEAKTIRETVRQFEGEAHLNSPVEMVHIRYAQFRNEIYIDLANDLLGADTNNKRWMLDYLFQINLRFDSSEHQGCYPCLILFLENL